MLAVFLDIICIQEHRYLHSENIKYHNAGSGWSFVSESAWKSSVNAAIGVGIFKGPQAIKSLNSIEKIQPRMMVAAFNGNLITTIISKYSPIEVNEETNLITFYKELSSLVRSIPKHNALVIGGDMNVQIGKDVNNQFSLHKLSNRNGEHLTHLTSENRLTCLNTKFQKTKGKQSTYTCENNAKAHTDYILINNKCYYNALNCKAYSSFEGVSSDHRLVKAKIRLSLRKTAARTTTTGP